MEGRTFFSPTRVREYTQIVYGGTAKAREDMQKDMRNIVSSYYPTPHPYQVFWGELHGHTELSDGRGSLDAYFRTARDLAQLDFCAITDHDHGGVGSPELWDGKWDLIQEKVAEYHEEGHFVTLLGYERDSFPWYPNMCIYYRNGRGELVRSEQDGEITRSELEALLQRDDVLAIPHQLSQMEVGTQFSAIPNELMPVVAEVYSKWGTSEYFDNPNPMPSFARGCFWQDALNKGARVGAVAGSDIHMPFPGLRYDGFLYYNHPGLVAVLAEELSREAIFDAIKARRCYAAAGARIELDFRVNECVMGSETKIEAGKERRLYVSVTSPAAIHRVTVVKNGEDTFVRHINGRSPNETFCVVDLEACQPVDYYYIRVTLQDGRSAWSSPIWVASEGQG